ncbi:MAG: hypothetical protein J5I99_08965 [Verrucomicrobia bacterium]|nr:hypothetical protein [Verrucomicrobiota bacterium]
MGVFHGLRGTLNGDATALVNVASGAALLWRAASSLHPVLRVVAIAGTAIAASWPMIAQHFESAAKKAERLKQSLVNAGVILRGYAAAVFEFSRLNDALDRQGAKLAAIEAAWKKTSGAVNQYRQTVADAKLANLNAEEQRALIESDGDPVNDSKIRAEFAKKRADVQYENDLRAIDAERDALKAETREAERERNNTARLSYSARDARAKAEKEYNAAYRRNENSGGRDSDAEKALGEAARNFAAAMKVEADARNDAKIAAIRLEAAKDAERLFTNLTEPTLKKSAEDRLRNTTENADKEVESAQLRKSKEFRDGLLSAFDELDQYEEEKRFSGLSRADQRKELDAKIAEKEAIVKNMRSLDPEHADTVRSLVQLKRRRDAIPQDEAKVGAQEGFDSFLLDRGRIPGGPQLADSKSARRFRSKLGPSFADKLTASSFGKSGKEGDTRTAEEKLLALQEKSVEYQKIMAEKIQDIALKE